MAWQRDLGISFDIYNKKQKLLPPVPDK